MGLEEALKYYDQGILPEKGDNVEDFIFRSELILKDAYDLQQNFKRPILKEESSNALESMLEKYGFDLSWVPCKHILYPMPGYGGCTEAYRTLISYGPKVDNRCEFTMPIVSINKLRMLGSFDKILKHELIHASRVYTEDYMKLSDLMLEEHIAWDEELKNKVLNCLNLALYDRKKRSLFLLLEVLGISSLMFNFPLGAIPFAIGAGAVFGHGYSKAQKGLNNLKNLKKTFEDLFSKKGKHVLSRLSKTEITSFYNLDKKDIKKYIDNVDSLKWQLIKSRI